MKELKSVVLQLVKMLLGMDSSTQNGKHPVSKDSMDGVGSLIEIFKRLTQSLPTQGSNLHASEEDYSNRPIFWSSEGANIAFRANDSRNGQDQRRL